MQLTTLMSETPDWLCALMQSKKSIGNKLSKQTAIAPPSNSLSGGEAFSEGRRNTDMVGLAGHLKRKGASPELIEHSLVSTNTKISRPLDELEVKAIARGIDRYSVSQIENITHKSFAENMLRDLKEKALYCTEGAFYIYKDNMWKRDDGALMVLNHAIQVTDQMFAQIQHLIGEANENDKAHFENIKKSLYKAQATPFLKNSIEQLKAMSEMRIDFSEFNSEKHLINMNNCTLNLLTGKTEPHSSENRFTWKLDFDFDPNAKCPTFDAFMDISLPKSVQKFLLKLVACSLTGNDRIQLFVYLHGLTGTGKSTIIKILTAMFKPLSANVEPISFMLKSGDSIPNDIARLAGKRFVFTSEIKQGSIADSALLKRLSAKDPVSARFMRGEWFEYTPEFLIFIATNYLPVISGDDPALTRRTIIIPFDNIVPEAQRDDALHEKLVLEKSGILNRVLEGLKDYEANGLDIPVEVRERVDLYVNSSNMILKFFNEKFEKSDDPKGIPARMVFSLYKPWMAENGLKSMSEPQFKTSFELTTGITQEYNKRGNYWPYIKMRM